MKTLKPALGTLLLGLGLTAFTALAQTSNGAPPAAGPAATQGTSQSTQAGAMSDDQLQRRYEAEKKRCENLKGDEKDICEKQAEANRDAAKAESERSAKTAEATHDANKEKKDAQYEVEKKKCEALSGDAQDRCMAELKTRFNK